jgi:PilZ domain
LPGAWLELLETPMECERRSITRTTISKDALLFFDAQRGVFTCRVQDVTNSGAGIELHTLNLLPLDFELSFDNFHTIRECRVIWRQGDFVGVAFQN